MIRDGLVLGAGCPELVVTQCYQKLRHFCILDAPPNYDAKLPELAEPADTIAAACVQAANKAMFARTSVAAWSKLVDCTLPELAAVPVDVDLVCSSDSEVATALDPLETCIARCAARKGITDMAATKVLYLKRPRLVAISDSYVREALQIQDPGGWSEKKRGWWYAKRARAVAMAVRHIGLENKPLIDSLRHELAEKTSIPMLSHARIIDALIWIDMAIPVNVAWRKRAEELHLDSILPKVLCRKHSLPWISCTGLPGGVPAK